MSGGVDRGLLKESGASNRPAKLAWDQSLSGFPANAESPPDALFISLERGHCVSVRAESVATPGKQTDSKSLGQKVTLTLLLNMPLSFGLI